MVNTSVRGTPFTVSIDGHPRHGVGTGISAADRAKTIQLAIDPSSTPDDFVRPGHINPLRARDGGVLVRTGQTEGSIDLARLAGLHPSALVIEIVREDGQMARRDDLEKFCAEHGFKMCSVEQLIHYRLERESLVRRQEPHAGVPVRTDLGEFTLHTYSSVVDPLPHIAMTLGGVGDGPRGEPTLVRVHRRNVLGDIFGDLDSSPEGPTRNALRAAMRRIQSDGAGAIVYIRSSDSTSALETRLATHRRDREADPDSPDLSAATAVGVAPHLRELGIGGQILRDLGLSKLRLLTNHPKALPGLEAYGLEIVEHVPLVMGV